MRSPKLQYNPSPQEISEMCATLQRRWTPAERMRRRSFQWGSRNPGLGPARAWQPPVVVLGPALAKVLDE
jgi:hypothetical protein